MLRGNKLVLVTIWIASLCIQPVSGFAQEEIPPGISQQKEIPGKGLHRGWEQGKHKGWKKEELLKLKQEEPEKFKEIVKEETKDCCSKFRFEQRWT